MFVWVVSELEAPVLSSYEALHTLTETVAIVIALMIFLIGWHSQNRSANVLFLSMAYLGVAFLDFAHMMSYPGMPDFVTPNSAQKAIVFWLAARSLEGAALLVAALLPACRGRVFGFRRVSVLAAGFLLIALTYGTGLFFADRLPRMYTDGQGLTALKRGVELGIIGLYTATVAVLVMRRFQLQGVDVPTLWVAVLFMIVQEVFFMFYVKVNDIFNFLGHICKIIAYLFLFRSVYLKNMREPFAQLKQSERRLRENEQWLRTILTSIGDAVIATDFDGRIAFMNPVAERLTGWSSEQALGRELEAVFRVVNEKTRTQEMESIVREAIQRGENQLGSVRCTLLIARDGREIPIEHTAAPIYDGTENILGVVVVFRDITERKQAEKQQRLASTVIESIPVGVLVTDSDGKILSVNPAFTAITGYRSEEVMGKTPRILRSGRHNDDFYHEMWERLRKTGRWKGEIWNRRKNGELYLEELSIAAVRNEAGEVNYYVGVFTDVTLRKQMEEQIQYQAYHDALTGLPNRAKFLEELQGAMARANREGTGLALLFFDLNRFKLINDTLGHSVGDLLLKAVADRLRTATGSGELAARLGGDEFTVLVTDIQDEQSVVQVVERVLRAFTDPFVIQEHELYVTPSIGIALYPRDARDPETLLKHADVAMYRAKKSGAAYRFYQPDLLVL